MEQNESHSGGIRKVFKDGGRGMMKGGISKWRGGGGVQEIDLWA